MQIEELKTFIRLCEIRNFTKTAESLSMSQPTVSLHIKNLEDEFQTQLIQRNSKQLNITPTGEILLECAKQITQLLEQTKQDIFEHHHKILGHLTIGASFTIGEYILPQLLAEIKKDYPNINLEVIIGNTDEIVEYVKLFKVDIGLIEGSTDEKSLYIYPFKQDELVVIAPIRHPLAKKETIIISDLHNEQWVAREDGSGTRANLNHFLHSNGLKVKSITTISSNQGVKELVRNGIGLSLLSKSVIEQDLKLGDIVILPLQNIKITRTFSYIYSPIMVKKSNVEIFIKTINDKWNYPSTKK